MTDEASSAGGITTPHEDTLFDERSPHERAGVGALPSHIGRYPILRQLGAGGMGVVYAGYDEPLDRRVAIKLLRGDRVGAGSAERLSREARVMAKLSHPNVAPVYEVGEHDGTPFVAMEFLEGGTIRQWLKEEERDWASVLEIFIGAAKGLEAAHQAGIIHRDFKPDNVLLGADGRPRVVDFGLARTRSEIVGETTGGERLPSPDAAPTTGAQDPSATEVSPESTSDLQPRSIEIRTSELDRLTQTGTLLGTPAYMSPEQHRRREVDARSDQFSFCVALYEALWKRRPFKGATKVAIAYAVTHGDFAPPPAASKVPKWIWPVIERGLSVDPNARHPDMAALADALRRDPYQTRRRLVAVGAAGVLLVGLGYGAASAGPGAASDRVCTGAQAALEATWASARHDEIRDAFEGLDLVYAASVGTAVTRGLDEYAMRWVEEHQRACEATRITGEQSEQDLERRMDCLDRRRRSLESAAAAMERISASEVEHAVDVLATLPSIESCADLRALRDGPAPPDDPEIAAEIAALESALSMAKVSAVLGNHDETIEALEPLFRRAEATGYRPLVARVSYLLGDTQAAAARYDDARQNLRAAHLTAIAAGEDAVARSAAITQVSVLQKQAEYELGLDWAERADALVVRAGEPPAERADLLSARGSIFETQGEYDRAIDAQTQAIALLESIDDNGASMVRARSYRASALMGRGEPKEAEAELAAAIDAAQTRLGDSHPGLAALFYQLGYAHELQSEFDEALDLYQQARALALLRKDPRHPELAQIEDGLGGIHYQRREYDEAYVKFEAVLEIRRASLGPDHPYLAGPMNNMGLILAARGNEEGALAKYREALAQHLLTLPPEHIFNLTEWLNIGNSLKNLGRYDEAEKAYREALRIAQLAHGEDDPQTAGAWQALGELARHRGDFRTGKSLFHKSLGLAEAGSGLQFTDASVLNGLGMCELELGELDSAAKHFQRSIQLVEDAMGAEHPDLVEPLRFLSEIHDRRREKPRAADARRRADAIERLVQDRDDPDD